MPAPPRPSRSLHSALVYGGVLVVIFATALVASFLYTRTPQRDTVSVSVAPTPTRPPATRVVGGTVASLTAGTLRVHTDSGDVDVALPSGVPVVQLERVPAGTAPFATGTRVNVGGGPTETGLVVSGVVAVGTATP